MTTTDPFATIPDAAAEYVGTELETGEERQRRNAGERAMRRRKGGVPAMSETTVRIRWTDNGMGGYEGYVGTSKRLTFELWQAPADAGFPTGGWVITSELPMPDPSNLGYTYAFSGKDPEELKVRAERRLEEFVASLGAVFPEAGQ